MTDNCFEGVSPVRLLRLREVEGLVGASRVTIWRLRRDGRFPQPVDIAGVGLRWRSDEVAGWVEAHSARAPVP